MTQSDVVRISVRLQQGASRDEVAGWQESGQPSQSKCNEIALALRVRVRAAPVDGAANTALVQLLAKRLGVAKSRVSLVSGATARNKVVEIEGISTSEAKNRLNHS